MEQGADVVMELVKPTLQGIGEGIATALKRQCDYLCCFSKNIKNLEKEAKKLENETVELQGKVDMAERNAKVILPKVTTWFTKTKELQDEREKIKGEILKAQSCCLNIVSRYSLSKRAKDTADGMKNQIGNSKIDPVAQPPPPASETPIPLGETILLPSRKDAEDGIVNVLASSAGSQKVGISGMGGVGKTTIAKKIMHRMMVEKLVDEAIMVTVAQQPDVSKLQLQMAEQLGFTELETFEKRTPQEWARQISFRLTNKRILIVLDDVWKILKLEDLGINCGGASCGILILLTSRDAEVLKQMNAKDIEIKILAETEAWLLFKDKVGAYADDSNIKPIAQKVAKECKGLPLALITVGSVLRDKKDESNWRYALRQLESPNPKQGTRVVMQVQDEVYKPLRLSYDLLQDENAKSLFLLCSLFPDDFEISLNDLALYSMGLRMFEGVHSLAEVKETTFIVIMDLKSRFLLMDCDDENKVKMHDVLRDLAIIIAKEKGLLGAKHESEGQFDENCKWISVFTNSKNELFDHGMDFNFPSLQFLAIHHIPMRDSELEELGIGDISLLEGMQELNVLSLRRSAFKSSGKSVILPKNLRTLHLEGFSSSYENILHFVDSALNLEILSCYQCLEIRELPKEMGRLQCLKLLNLSLCRRISRIPPGVIASLIQLEELKMLCSFDGWESSKVKVEDRKNVALKELQSLKKLRCLEIQISDTELAKEEISLPPEIEKYAIFIGEKSYRPLDLFDWISKKSDKVFSLSGFPRNTEFANWVYKLISTTDGELYFDGDCLTNFDLSQVHNKIKTLEIGCCGISSVLHLVRTPNPEASFDNLRRIRVEECHKLRNLSWLRRTNDGILLPHLEEIVIVDCELMEEVVLLSEENDGTVIIFSNLMTLGLKKLPSLATLVRGAETIQFPKLENLIIGDCPKLLKSMENGGHNCADGCLHLFCTEKVHFSRLKHLSLNDLVENKIWCPRISSSFFQQLETLEIKDCHELVSLFEPSVVKNLVNLDVLHIENCRKMEQVVALENEGETSDITIFPNLSVLKLRELYRMKSLGKGIAGLEFPMLISLIVLNYHHAKEVDCSASECGGCIDSNNHDGEALHLFYHHKVQFDGLRHLIIANINIRSNLSCQQIPRYFFRELTKLCIDACMNIENLFSISMVEKLVNLEHLSVTHCWEMKQVIIVDEVRNEIQKENDDGDNDSVGAAGNKHHITLFPKLRRLHLWDLPKLTCFGKGMESIEFPMLEDLEIGDCPDLIGMVASSGKSKTNIENDEERIQEQNQKQKQKHCDDENSNVLFNHKVKFDVLQSIRLHLCNNLRSICSCTMVEDLVNLKYLIVEECFQMEKVITDGNVHESIIRFPRIKSIELSGLPSFRMFSSWSGALEFPYLEKMSIKKCPKWECLSPGPIITPRLPKMEINKESIESSTEVGESSKTTILEIEEMEVIKENPAGDSEDRPR